MSPRIRPRFVRRTPEISWRQALRGIYIKMVQWHSHLHLAKERAMNEESVFAAALEKTNATERQEYLDDVCRGDSNLRQRVEQLLAADRARAGNTRPGLHAAAMPSLRPSRHSRPIGSSTIDTSFGQKLGEGGMGEVWVADQIEPVQRRVALKLIRPGFDSARLLARFDQERQALALMDHPNIAKVLDAGVTKDHGAPGGSPAIPYFVMELIKGTSITEYCDRAKLSPRQRLELVHSGLSRRAACSSEGPHSSRFEAVQHPGCDLRRQAGAEGDRFRRGQGDRPAAHRAKHLHGSRLARGHAGIHVARTGGVEQPRHRHAERHLRAGAVLYETANGLATDLQRYLQNEPVIAGPPSATYRLRKFVRRHRGSVMLGSALIATLIGGGGALLAIRAEASRIRAAREARAVAGVAAGVSPTITRDRESPVRREGLGTRR